MSFKGDLELGSLVKEIMEIVGIKLCAQERISMHYGELSSRNREHLRMHSLPDVRGSKFVNFFSAALIGVSEEASE